MEITQTNVSDQVPPALSDPKGSVLRPDQVREHQHQMKMAQAQLEDPRVQDKGGVRKRMQEIRKQYDAQAPRPITDGQLKDRLAKRASTLLEEIMPGMVSQEEMRKNPAGTVDLHMKWERKNKKKIMEWKKIQRCLSADQSDPHTWDRDAANLERFRPVGPGNRLRVDAQIGGHMSYGSVPQENWDQAFEGKKPDSALEQAKRVDDQKRK